MNWQQLLENIESFDWDAGNINKNFIKHGVRDRESEEVFFNDRLSYPDSKHSSGEARYAILGMTDAGRILSTSFTFRGKKVRVISSRPVNKKEKQAYEEAFKKDSQI